MWHETLRNYTGRQVYHTFVDKGGGLCAMSVIFGNPTTAMNVMMDQHELGISWAGDKIGMFECPKCLESQDYYNSLFIKLSELVMHLNDLHYYSFKQIADIIRPFEEKYHRINGDPDEDKDIDAEAPKSNTPEKELVPA